MGTDEELHLEAAYIEAEKEHARAMAKLAEARRSLPKSEYLMVQREAEIARIGAEAARRALEAKKGNGEGNWMNKP